MLIRRTRQMSAVTLLLASPLTGCGSTDTVEPRAAPEPDAGPVEVAPAPAPADLLDTCGPGWVEACTAVGCDPGDPAWVDCRLNGWSGYRAPGNCAPETETGYPGDEDALCAPTPDEGFQLRFGPSDYSDLADVERHLIQPGASTIECVYLPLPNTERRHLGQLVGSVRPGVHHTQLRFVDQTPTSSSESEFCLPFGGEHVHMGQSAQFSVPDLDVPSPEPGTSDLGGLDFGGSAIPLDPGRVVAFELHYINTRPEPILREGWINFYYQPEDAVRNELKAIQLIGTGIRVEPRTTGVVRRSCETDTPRRVTHLQGHSHEGATRFSIWVHRASSDSLELVYESYDPTEPALLAYSDAVRNATPDPEQLGDGGFSGTLELGAGDALVWECEIDNPNSTAIVDGGPNENGDQMCYVFGNFVTEDSNAQPLWGCGASEPSPH